MLFLKTASSVLLQRLLGTHTSELTCAQTKAQMKDRDLWRNHLSGIFEQGESKTTYIFLNEGALWCRMIKTFELSNIRENSWFRRSFQTLLWTKKKKVFVLQIVLTRASDRAESSRFTCLTPPSSSRQWARLLFSMDLLVFFSACVDNTDKLHRGIYFHNLSSFVNKSLYSIRTWGRYFILCNKPNRYSKWWLVFIP